MAGPGRPARDSTPFVDLGGDYAWAVFKRAEALRPGAEAILYREKEREVA